MITSETRGASTPARSSAALIAVLPSSWAGNEANAPLNAPTGVRVALTITTSSFMAGSFRLFGATAGSLAYVIGTPRGLDKAHQGANPTVIFACLGHCAGGWAAPHKKVAAPCETGQD